MATALELSGIRKTFDNRIALHDAAFAVGWGEVHALLGQNGAGKSTLMNVACGLYAADAGRIEIDGTAAAIAGPGDAARRGLGMVHQHFKLVRRFTVAENILLACGRALGIRSTAAAAAAIRRKADEVGFAIEPLATIDALSLAEQQRVEIVRLLLLGARILILDEPTAVLTDREADAVLALLRRLAARGGAVVLITHKLREVTGFADRVTVMRDGATVLASAPTQGLDRAALARLMVGEAPAPVAPPPNREGAVRLAVSGLSLLTEEGRALRDVSFAVGAGQIYGIAGVGGNGQSELADALTGLRRPATGSIRIDGREVAGGQVGAHRRLGLRAVPADRYRTGLLADLQACENFAITGIAAGRFGGRLRVARQRMRAATAAAIARHRIIGCAPPTPTRLLSGGNAQKLLLARELEPGMAVLIAHSPTRGLDVQATSAVRALLRDAAAEGCACLLISEDLEEILELSNRVAVMSRGRIVGEFAASEAQRERIGTLMLGHA